MIKVAIIGMGMRGNFYTKAVKYNAYAEVVAFSETNPKYLDEAKDKFGIDGYSDYNQMFEDKKIDLAIIALPDHLHKEATIRAASRKINVLIEKPLATSLDDAKVMVSEIKKAGIKAMVAFENRWNPVFVSAKESLDNKEITNIQLMNGCLCCKLVFPSEMISWASKTTVACCISTHIIDVALWLSAKKVLSVYATGQKNILSGMGINTYDSITTTLKFKDGTVGTFFSSWIYPNNTPLMYDLRLEILGNNGAIKIDCRDQMIHKITDIYSHPPILGSDIYGKPVGFTAEMLNSFIDNIREDTKPLVNIDEGLYVVKIIDTIHRSIISGKVEEVID